MICSDERERDDIFSLCNSYSFFGPLYFSLKVQLSSGAIGLINGLPEDQGTISTTNEDVADSLAKLEVPKRLPRWYLVRLWKGITACN